MSRLGRSSEDSSLTQDASRATDEPIRWIEKLEQRFEKQDPEYRFQEQDQCYKDLRSNRHAQGLPGQKVRPLGEGAYSKAYGESGNDSLADGEVRDTPSENQPEMPLNNTSFHSTPALLCGRKSPNACHIMNKTLKR